MDTDAADPSSDAHLLAVPSVPAATTGPARDPVCGMDLDPSQAPAQLVYKSKRFFFCCASCRKTFEDHPERYAGRTGPPDVAPVPMH